MAGAFPKRRSTIPVPLACWACASGRRCWAAKCDSPANPEREQRSASAFPSRRRTGRTDMKILITDDHTVVRQGLKLILADRFKKSVFGEARNAHEALTRAAKEKWD